jgi:hypothetical protein
MRPFACLLLFSLLAVSASAADAPRLRLIIETDAGGDPDDEQSPIAPRRATAKT